MMDVRIDDNRGVGRGIDRFQFGFAGICCRCAPRGLGACVHQRYWSFCVEAGQRAQPRQPVVSQGLASRRRHLLDDPNQRLECW
jgi:hypothetical protein